MQLERLRLAGFKSFVEPTELAIEPGLTGIVGPNGCGKSNLVEALRWVMGESSAKRLRGGEMDDVIFGGTASRPARNLAEVALTLDNGGRDAPFAFNDSATIEVARRIERGAGSTFRINGREARARDVQLLFADAASGAHSGRDGQPGPDRRADRRQAERAAAAARRGGGHRRAPCAPARGRAETATPPRTIWRGSTTSIATMAAQIRHPEEAGAAGAALSPARRADPAHRGAAVAGPLAGGRGRGRAQSPPNCAPPSATVADATEAALARERERARRRRRLCRRCAWREAAAAAALQRLTHARESLEAELQRVVAARARGRAPAGPARRRSRTRGRAPRRRATPRSARFAEERGALDAPAPEPTRARGSGGGAAARAAARASPPPRRAAADDRGLRRRRGAPRRARAAPPRARRARAPGWRRGCAESRTAARAAARRAGRRREAVAAAGAAVAAGGRRVEPSRAEAAAAAEIADACQARRAGGARRGARRPSACWRGSRRRPRR